MKMTSDDYLHKFGVLLAVQIIPSLFAFSDLPMALSACSQNGQ